MVKLTTLFIWLPMTILIVGISIGYYQKYNNEITTKNIIEWSEKNEIKIESSEIKRTEFKVEYNKDEWDNLVKKLELTRYFSVLTDVDRFSYGFDPEYAKELVDYWKSKFDWKKQVDYLNKYPQFKVNINGTSLHYVRYTTNPQVKEGRRNLLLVDGWPGSYFGFFKMIESIEQNFKDVSFNIIAPSIPGYCFSTPLTKRVDLPDTAFLFDALMRFEFGQDCQYFVHGEDWGSGVATNLAQMFPKRVAGVHLTLSFSSEFTNLLDFSYYMLGQLFPTLFFSPEEIKHNFPSRFSIWNRFVIFFKDLGYMHLQATKPDTLAHGLTDSPVGLLAYILEKYSSWSFSYEKDIVGKRDGNLNQFSKDDLLTVVTVYWMTNSISSSIRYYKNNFNFDQSYPKSAIRDSVVSKSVPAGFLMSTNDILAVPENVCRMKFPNLVRFKIQPDSGHFAAFQNPKLTSTNFIEFVKSI